MRVRFEKGKQRQFIQKVLEKMNCPSLKELIQRGVNINYSTLKNYYSEKRTMPEELFNDLCDASRINREKLKFRILHENFGQVLGGKKSKKS